MKATPKQFSKLKWAAWALLVIGLTVFVNIDNASSASGQRAALVIGNGAYPQFPLKNPTNDAKDLAYVLKKLGFSVTTEINASHREMRDAIHQFGNTLSAGGVGLFYFAGHGVQVNGINYLLPIDADIRDQSDIPYEAIDAGRILSKMEQAANKLNIIILDACRNNPFRGQFRSINRGLAKMDAPTGSILAYSTAPGSVAADGDGRNGLYTSKLLKYIRQDGLSIESVFKQVRIEVMQASGNRQVPWESSSLTVDFFFVAPKQVRQPAKAISKPQNQVKSAEVLFWESVRGSKDIRLYEEYLRVYPNGTFATLAKLQIQELTQAAIATKVAKTAKSEERPAKKYHQATAPKSDRAAPKMKLAILPWRPANADWNAILMNAIEEAIRNTRHFDPAFSFYEMAGDFESVKLTVAEILAMTESSSIDSLWQASSEGQWEPNLVEAMKVANYLGVDALLMCHVWNPQTDPHNKSVAMYLIDVWSGDTHIAKEFIANFDENVLYTSTRLGLSLLDRKRNP